MNHTQLKLDEITHIATNKGTTTTIDIACAGRHDYEDVLLVICDDVTINYLPDRYGCVYTLVKTNDPNVMIRVSFYRPPALTVHNGEFDTELLTNRARERGKSLGEAMRTGGDVYSNPLRDYNEPKSTIKLRLIPSKGNGLDLEHDAIS